MSDQELMQAELGLPETEIVDDQSNEVIPYQYAITSYGVDYPVDSLVKRMDENSIFIPRFQRGFVWSFKQASRFVESLLLGLPVPSIFLSREEASNKLLVIDGQQRLRTLQWFYSGVFSPDNRPRLFALEGVQSSFDGATYESLRDEDKRMLDDSIMHAIIVRQDEPTDDNSSIYHIFERLNTGGRTLVAQEIRSAIYHGEFSELLKELNENQAWRQLFGPIRKDMRDQELILRFFSLALRLNEYQKPMKQFLNSFMAENRNLEIYSAEFLLDIFSQTVDVVLATFGEKAFKPRGPLNAAYFDAISVGVYHRLQRGNITDDVSLREMYDILVHTEVFIHSCEDATTDEMNVRTRIGMAVDAFEGVA